MDALLSKLVNSITGDRQGVGKDYWVDDSKCKACYECETPFSVFVRRHHCRVCGRIFCSNCTVNTFPSSRDPGITEQGWLRVCNYCHRMRQRDYEPSSQSPVAQLSGAHLAGGDNRLYQDNSSGHGTGNPESHSNRGAAAAAGSPSKLRQSLSRNNAGADGPLTWEVPALLERSLGPAAEQNAGEAAAHGQPAAACSSSMDSIEAAGGAPVPQPGVTQGSSSAALAVTVGSSPDGTPSTMPLGSSGLHPLVHLYRQAFAKAADEHLQLLVRQLIVAEEVQAADAWLPIVVKLACQAARSLLPAAAAAYGQQDPRSYVKVKRLPGMGSPADSCVVKGVAAKKNVAHRRMRSDISSPSVLLLSGSLEYQRVANRLSSFDTLLEQEREHLRLAVARIAAFKPDVLLVERSVARAAQEELLSRNISLVQHTKPELLERLGRCMGVQVAATVEELTPQHVGTCSRFKVEPLLQPRPQQQQQQPNQAVNAGFTTGPADSSASTATSIEDTTAATAARLVVGGPTAAAAVGNTADATIPPTTPAAGSLQGCGVQQQPPLPGGAKLLPVSATPAPAKTLMVFDGCPIPLGCTVLLWGASASELTKLKRIIRFGVLAAYHLGLETSFLAEEMALATAALAMPDMMSSSPEVYHSLARAAISSSHDITNPCGCAADSRLLLSLSPYVLVLDALGQEQRHAAAAQQQQQPRFQQNNSQQSAVVRPGTGIRQLQEREQQQKQPTGQQVEQQQLPLSSSEAHAHLQQQPSDHEQQAQNTQLEQHLRHAAGQLRGLVLQQQQRSSLQPLPAPLPAAVGNSAAADADSIVQELADLTTAGGDSSVDLLGAVELGDPADNLLQPEYTDPLRRLTVASELSELELSELAEAAEELETGACGGHMMQPLWLQGLQLYDRQHIYLSMACRNPPRGLMCEPPAIKRIDYYCRSDLSLAGFIVAAAPHPQKRCQGPGCGDGVSSHVRTFLHGGSRITLSIATLPPSEALPGEERGQVWTWLRPKAVAGRANQPGAVQAVRRLPLSQPSACMSFGMFLSLCCCAPGLEVLGHRLHGGFVRYFGLGRTVMCCHQDSIYPSAVELPRLRVGYCLNAQLMWLKQEAAELCQESNEAFDVLESALHSHPYFKTQPAVANTVAAAATGSPLAATGTVAHQATNQSPKAAVYLTDTPKVADTEGAAAGVADTSGQAGINGHAADTGSPTRSQAASTGNIGTPMAAVAPATSPLVSMSGMLSALRKDRTSFMDKVAEVVVRATPEEAIGDGNGSIEQGGLLWDEQLMSGMLELNRLRRSLAISTLTWAATLQEPSFFTQMLAASSAAGPVAAAAATAAAAAPGSPLAAAAAAAAAAVAAGLASRHANGSSTDDVDSNNNSAHGGSMFHLPVSVAAQHMGIPDSQGDSDASCSSVSVPIVPNSGPIAVEAVANLVAQQAAREASAGLLEGSQSVVMAVAQRASEQPDTEPASKAATDTIGELAEPSSSSGLNGRATAETSNVGLNSKGGLHATGRASLQKNNSSKSRGRHLTTSSSCGSGQGSLPGSPSIANASMAGSPGRGLAVPALNHRVSSSASNTGSAEGAAGGLVSPSSASYASSSIPAQQPPQQQHHRRNASATGSSVGAAVLLRSCASGGDVGYDSGSDDGEVAHDRFVEWMTSHEISTALDTDDLSDNYPEQLPEWDESADAAATAAAGDGDGSSEIANADTTPVGHQPPVPPATPDLGSRDNTVAAVSNGAVSAAADTSTAPGHQALGEVALNATAAASGQSSLVGGASNTAFATVVQRHRRMGSADAFVPANLAPIKTQSAAANAGHMRSSSSASVGTVGLQQIARVALPGRALMPAGINDTVIPIFDLEPTSVAAYFLSSRVYQLQLNAQMKQILQEDKRGQQGRHQQGSIGNSLGNDSSNGNAATPSGYQPLPTSAVTSNKHGRSISRDISAGGIGVPTDDQASSALGQARQQEAPSNAAFVAGSSSSRTGSLSRQQQQQQQQATAPTTGPRSLGKQPDWLALLLSPEPLHVKHAFEDESPGMPWLRARFSVTAYFAPQFAELRRRCIAGGEAAYITSLCRCRKWASRGGKSNAYFAKTRDDRFIVKSLSKPEKVGSCSVEVFNLQRHPFLQSLANSTMAPVRSLSHSSMCVKALVNL
eukprot:GHRR01010909.1.p1 GENE.GHRR01010909.1~~GHRR01010909.1.p1  ORF type:complete len:2140 (+),score=1004.14 GHRR01010909.1:414-6833(+)